MAELSSHSNRTPAAINTRYTHHERKRMSSQPHSNPYHTAKIIVLLPIKFYNAAIFYFVRL